MAFPTQTSKHDDAKLGIVLIAHGSRLVSANEELLEVAAGLRAAGFNNVVPGYLELAEPGMVDAAELAIAAGATTVVMTPYFLSAGRHATQDLEHARAEVQRRHPRCIVHLARPLGPDSLLVELLNRRISEVTCGQEIQNDGGEIH